jgi:chromosome segregation ATPase
MRPPPAAGQELVQANQQLTLKCSELQDAHSKDRGALKQLHRELQAAQAELQAAQGARTKLEQELTSQQFTVQVGDGWLVGSCSAK